MVGDRPDQIEEPCGQDRFRGDNRTQIGQFPAGLRGTDGNQPAVHHLSGEGNGDPHPRAGVLKKFPGDTVVEETIQMRERDVDRHLGDLFDGRNLEQCGRHAQPFTALASASARSVRSHVASASVRPKCPRVENCR